MEGMKRRRRGGKEGRGELLAWIIYICVCVTRWIGCFISLCYYIPHFVENYTPSSGRAVERCKGQVNAGCGASRSTFQPQLDLRLSHEIFRARLLSASLSLSLLSLSSPSLSLSLSLSRSLFLFPPRLSNTKNSSTNLCIPSGPLLRN